MPTYNRAAYIGAALDSVARQIEPALEVVVVDDGSGDETRRLVEMHPLGAKVRYHLQPTRQGASTARNAGVEMARGNVIVFLDSDDVLEPHHHQVARGRLEASPSVGLFCSDVRMIGSRGEALSEQTYMETQCSIGKMRIASGLRTLEDVFLLSTPFPGMSVRREVYRRVGGLDQDLFPLDDYDLQLRVAAAGFGIHYEHRPLARYRIHDANESGVRRGVRVGRQKLRCVELALKRCPALRRRARSRLGEVRREIAFSLLREGDLGQGAWMLIRSLADAPSGVRHVLRLGVGKMRARKALCA
jgi:glycosyltransferase involved in cell wall biosynthesis